MVGQEERDYIDRTYQKVHICSAYVCINTHTYKGFICGITVFTDLHFSWFRRKFWPSLTNATRLTYFAFGEFFSKGSQHLPYPTVFQKHLQCIKASAALPVQKDGFFVKMKVSGSLYQMFAYANKKQGVIYPQLPAFVR